MGVREELLKGAGDASAALIPSPPPVLCLHLIPTRADSATHTGHVVNHTGKCYKLKIPPRLFWFWQVIFKLLTSPTNGSMQEEQAI